MSKSNPDQQPILSRVGGNAAPVGSPCINICQMDDTTGWCKGCFRNLDEIAFWSQLDDEDKSAVWLLLPERRAQSQALQGSTPDGSAP